MSKPKKAVIFYLFSLFLFVLSTLLINSIDTNPNSLFYYALNAFFVSLTVFALPSCFFMLQGIFTKNGHTPDFSLLTPSPLSLIISSLLAPLIFLLGTVLSSLFFSLFNLPPMEGFRPTPSFWAILTTCIIPSIAEELFFRGVLLSCWRCLGYVRVVTITAFLFAIMHTTLFSFLSIFMIGILLSSIAFYSHSVFPCIAFHIFYNLAWLLLPTHFSCSVFILVFGIFALVFVIAFLIVHLFRHFSKKTPSVQENY